MEQFIPFIIAALVFGYQIYANFQKEQEKARKRNPKQPVPGDQRRPAQPQSRPITEKQATKTQHHPAAEIPANRAELSGNYESYSGMLSEEEYHRQRRKNKAQAVQDKRKESFLKEVNIEEERNETGFDLRDAIIKAAILERPYK